MLQKVCCKDVRISCFCVCADVYKHLHLLFELVISFRCFLKLQMEHLRYALMHIFTSHRYHLIALFIDSLVIEKPFCLLF